MNLPEIFVGAVVIRHDTVLLVKQQGAWQVPAGDVVKGLSLQQAAQEAVLTTTGLTVRAGWPIYNFDFIRRGDDAEVVQHSLVINVTADFVSGEFRLGSESDVAWVSIEAMEFMDIDEGTLVLLEAVDFLVLE